MSNTTDLSKIKSLGIKIIDDMNYIKKKIHNLEKTQNYIKKNIINLNNKLDNSSTMIICDNINDNKNKEFASFDKILNMINNIDKEENNDDNKNNELDVNYDDNIYVDNTNIYSINNFIELDDKIDSINDLIKIANRLNKNNDSNKKWKKSNKNEYKNLFFSNGKYYSIDINKLPLIVKPLEKLNRMIGLEDIKKQILNFVIYFLQNNDTNNLLHTTIEGAPGVGKTHIGKIIAELYANLGVIKTNKFKLVRRTDLIGTYLGHTAHKTQKIIDEAEGGVLFIDEAYSLGSTENDIYSKECIDTINQNLTENKHKLIIIIAGYTDELDKCFFSVNPGLKRRFPFRFIIKDYTNFELKNIFIYKLKCNNLKLDINSISDEKIIELFNNNHDKFKHYGGDIDNLITICKFINNKRLFGKHPQLRNVLTWDDIIMSLSIFIKNTNNHEKDYMNMYI